MAPQATQAPYASDIGNSIYDPSGAMATAAPSATTAPVAPPDDANDAPRNWANYAYIVIVFAVVFLLLGFFYRRKRRISAVSSSFPRNRFQAFHTHHPSQSRDLSAVQANNRVWRNMRAGPFSHHARTDSAGTRRPGTSSTTGRTRLDADEEVPPPYVLAEPERTLERGPSSRGATGLWHSRRTRHDVDMDDLLRGGDAGSTNKPPGYEERNVTQREMGP